MNERPSLRPLSPAYDQEQHGDYVEVLTSDLTKEGADVPRNIALTGHYGSGKSSVLVQTQRELEKKGVKVVNLSLPSLGVGEGRIPEKGNKALDKTNLIQKEIVKQLLYRRKPSQMPASRYSRLDTFGWGGALGIAATSAVVITGVALVAKLPNRVRDALPPKAWQWIDAHLWGNLAAPIQWSSLIVVGALGVLVALWVQRLLKQRIRVTELAAGPTKVTLSDSASSYFDEYLDEIVYFFQMSRTAVVIFEDLDRFKDPHIFEALRELNLLLNNAEQTGSEPIRFVYAIRDSIFEQLGVDDDEEGEALRLSSTNRTKFFDLVVPMVPFISHRTSRDLIRRELESVPEHLRPGNSVVDIVGAHLTDMRLIKNICNEYDVFRRRILSTDGLHELTPDRLFASIVYKNLHLADYEKIRDGASRFDVLYRAYREWVSQQISGAREDERSARTRLTRMNAVGARSVQLGRRLQDVLVAHAPAGENPQNFQISVGGVVRSWSDLSTEGFWRAYFQSGGELIFGFRPGMGSEVLTLARMEALMDRSLSPDEWAEEARKAVEQEIAMAVSAQRAAQHASMMDALGATDRVFSYEGRECSVADVVEDLFGGAGLVVELLRRGLVDENFTLYVTQFPGQAISASAMNFIIKAVQPDVMDLEYHFGSPDDIEAVLEAEGERLLGGNSAYNIELFDHLLATDPTRLAGPIRRLATGADKDLTFVNAYLVSGTGGPALVSQLTADWYGIFAHLIGGDQDSMSIDLLDAALRGVRPEIAYSLTDAQRDVLADALPDLAAVRQPMSQDRAEATAETLHSLGIDVARLDDVAEPLRSEVIRRSLYPVTLANLGVILAGDSELPLDRIKEAREGDVYPHVLDHLDDYLAAVAQIPGVPTIAEANAFTDVLGDIGEVDVDAVEGVAHGAEAACVVEDIEELDEMLWPLITAAHRLALTAGNVTAYIVRYQVDDTLADWLTTAGRIVPEPPDPVALQSLALKLLNATSLRDETALELVGHISLDPGSIAVEQLQEIAHPMLPELIEMGLVLDDADAYLSLGDDDWEIKERLIAVSKAFPTYMTSVDFSTNELSLIAARPVPEQVKAVLLADFPIFEAKLGPNGATTLADWAGRTGRTPTPEAIVSMAQKGRVGAARPIIRLLGQQAATMDVELLKQALDAIGPPYSDLTRPGRTRPKVDRWDGITEILTRLKEIEIVSTFQEKKGRIEVSKRHS